MMLTQKIAQDVTKKKLTYLTESKFNSLYSCIDAAKKQKIQGDFLEFGVALGGSALCLASEIDGERRFLGFDVFGMIPPPSERDGEEPKKRYDVIKSGKSGGIEGEKYYGYLDDLYGRVVKVFSDFGLPVDGYRIQLIRGLFEETLPRVNLGPVALAHIDCDWYDPVLYCLQQTHSVLSVGGFMILDDYNDWPGCRKATDHFCSQRDDVVLVRTQPHAVIQKVR